MNVELCDVQTYLLQEFTRQSSSQKEVGKNHGCAINMYPVSAVLETRQSVLLSHLLVPRSEPPFPIHPATPVQPIGSICAQKAH